MNTLDKTIFGALFFSLFATITGVGIVVPLLPVFAHDMGAGGIYIGVIFGAFSLSRTVFLPYFGKLSDKKGRRPFIISGLAAYTVISFIFILARNVEGLIIIRLIQGVASAMIMPVVQAYIGDITPAGSEGFTMGLFNTAMFLGLSFGPLLGGLIKDQFNLNAAFISMGVLSLIGFLLCYFWLPPTHTEKIFNKTRNNNQRNDKISPLTWHQLYTNRGIVAILVFRFVYAACIGVVWGFLPVFADFEFKLSGSSIGILVMIGVFISGLMHIPMGLLADRLDKRLMVIFGGLIVSYSVLSFLWSDGFSGLLIAGICFGIGGGISMPALSAITVIKGNVIGAMGRLMAITTMAHSLGMMVGSLMGGVMMDLWKLHYVFPLGALIQLLGTLLFAFLMCTKGSGGD
ncbi:MFS transporter [Desulfococcaceae bacterium HSG9]|nr:MFS transporter [Desulfococcaceae bacterium HSG9]